MKVLSLFDGMSCGQIALERAGIKVDKYYASEIDKYAIQVTQKNYPDTIQLGDVTKWREWDLSSVDLILVGSPCQGLSFAGKMLGLKDDRSKLFYEFVDILDYYDPKYFLLENVLMGQESNDVISCILGDMYPECVKQKQMFQAGRLDPIIINSALVSAQNRKRLYWTNIPDVEQPEDKGVLLEDILECGEPQRDKSQTVPATIYKENAKSMLKRNKMGLLVNVIDELKKNPRVAGVSITDDGLRPYKDDGHQGSLSEFGVIAFPDSKSATCTTGHSPKVIIPVIKQDGELIYKPNKSQCLDANYFKGPDNHGQRTGCIEVGQANGINGHDILKRIYSPAGKIPTLTAICGGNQEKKIAVDACHWRKLTCVECERLQTVPDNYTNHVSNSQRYKMLGNGWTVDVIAHILKSINKT